MQFSLLERTLAYGLQFLAGFAVITLLAAAALGKKQAADAAEKAWPFFAAAMTLVCSFIFIYAMKKGDVICGVPVDRTSALLLAASACFFAFVARPQNGEIGHYMLYTLAFAAAHAALFWGNPAIISGAFIALDLLIFASMCLKKDDALNARGMMPAKTLYIAAFLVFAALFLVSSGKPAKMALAGMIIFMMLSANAGLFITRPEAGEEGERFLSNNTGIAAVSGILPALIITRFIAETGGGYAARPVIIAAAALACFNIYRTITEEKYAAFAAHDALNVFFLLPAIACGTNAGTAELVPPALLFMMSAVLQDEFILSHDRGKHTVASVKYGFDKVKGAKPAFFGLISGLAAEAWVFFLFYRHLKQDPLVFIAVIFIALVFSVAMLNKVFMVFSMLKRFKSGAGFDIGFLRSALFAAYAAVMLAWWLK